ncbi:MAG TPA: NirA family protein [Methylomirabilota bacterium]|nr:NirA family protein [Methylomirabilota bacterium]
MPTLTEIAGRTLTSEQSAYLDGLFTGLRNRGFAFTDILPDPAAAPPPPAGTGERIAEERIKQELHPLDAYHLIEEAAAANRAPEKENVFRFKWHGLFWLSPNKESFMCRLRIPGGIVRTFQWRELAHLSRELTSGCVQITTRANLQLRLIEPRHAPAVIQRIQGVGLGSRGAGADNIRNLTANPTAGIDPHELIDVSPFVQQLARHLIHHREFYDLPRKFNIAFDGGGRIGSVEDTNDIGLKAVKLDRPAGDNQAGIYFRVALGGATGHQAFARDLGVLVPPGEVVKVTLALVRVFIRNGNRSNRKKARLKHLLESWSLDRYRQETEKLLGYTLTPIPSDAFQNEPSTPPSSSPHSHMGVFPQSQPGLNYIGVALPVGQLTAKQMLRLADIADHYGCGEIRLTVWQNLLIPGVPDAYVETVKKSLVKAGLNWRMSNLRGGLVACTGNSYCKYAASNTKGHAAELADYLEKRVELDQPINIHLTGCPHSCAQHYIGDIGLLGTKVKVSGESVEGYHVFVGGGFGEHQAIGRQVFQGISFESLKPTLETMLRAYLRHRQPGETFRAFTQRHDLNTLQTLFSNA